MKKCKYYKKCEGYRNNDPICNDDYESEDYCGRKRKFDEEYYSKTLKHRLIEKWFKI